MKYLSYSMVVILLSLLLNHDNVIPKLYQKKSSYLGERWLYIGRFTFAIVPGMTNKDVLGLFILNCKMN